MNFIGKYEEALSQDAKQRGFHGVICGHIHHAAIRWINGIHYVNTGDWVESCTAIVEEPNGELRLIDWEARNNRVKRLAKRRKHRQREARMSAPQIAKREEEQV